MKTPYRTVPADIVDEIVELLEVASNEYFEGLLMRKADRVLSRWYDWEENEGRKANGR
jgi:hypothetical protein